MSIKDCPNVNAGAHAEVCNKFRCNGFYDGLGNLVFIADIIEAYEAAKVYAGSDTGLGSGETPARGVVDDRPGTGLPAPTDQPDELSPHMEQAYRQYPDLDFGITPDDMVRFLEQSVALKSTYANASFVHKFMLQAAMVIRKLCEGQSNSASGCREAFEAHYRVNFPDADFSHHNWNTEFNIWATAWKSARAPKREIIEDDQLGNVAEWEMSRALYADSFQYPVDKAKEWTKLIEGPNWLQAENFKRMARKCHEALKARGLKIVNEIEGEKS